MKSIILATYLSQPLNHIFFKGLAELSLTNCRLEKVFVYVPPVLPPWSQLKTPRIFFRKAIAKVRTYYVNKNLFSSLIYLVRNIKKVTFYRDIKNIASYFSESENDEISLFIFWAGQIVSKDIYKSPKFISIMFHSGALPQYRGSDTLFWQLKNNEQKLGCSLALLNSPVDSGDIIYQDFVKPDFKLQPLPRLKKATRDVEIKGVDLTLRAIQEFDVSGALRGVPQQVNESQKIYKSPSKQDLWNFFNQLADDVDV